MGALADRLDAIRVRVRVPGTGIEAELRDRRDVEVSFGEGGYAWLHEADLEHHLATLARLLHAGWARQHRAALAAAGLDVDPPEPLRNREFEAARDAAAVSGRSADGRVTISAVGLRGFTVRVVRGTQHALPEAEFLARVREATAAFFADLAARTRELRSQYLTEPGQPSG
jgi:hypothetical protein